MLNLYWKSDAKMRTLIEKPFASEMALEVYLYTNEDLLDDVSIIHRQIRTGNNQGIPDMLGVDQDGRVCILELKNVEADEDILPQALGYAIWAETNPDSIKAIWLESESKPEDIEIDWDNLDIRVILVAPGFKETVPRMVGKIGYDVDLVQLQRFCFDDQEFMLVDVLEEPEPTKIVTTKPKGDWDWDYYASEHGQEATAQFRRMLEAVNAYVQQQGWGLPYNLNKNYAGFKLGNRLVFSVAWGGTYAWQLRLKIPEAIAETFQGEDWEFPRYSEQFKEAIFRPVDPENTDVRELAPFLDAAYENISGK
jgi:hypothetical protein